MISLLGRVAFGRASFVGLSGQVVFHHDLAYWSGWSSCGFKWLGPLVMLFWKRRGLCWPCVSYMTMPIGMYELFVFFSKWLSVLICIMLSSCLTWSIGHGVLLIWPSMCFYSTLHIARHNCVFFILQDRAHWFAWTAMLRFYTWLGRLLCTKTFCFKPHWACYVQSCCFMFLHGLTYWVDGHVVFNMT